MHYLYTTRKKKFYQQLLTHPSILQAIFRDGIHGNVTFNEAGVVRSSKFKVNMFTCHAITFYFLQCTRCTILYVDITLELWPLWRIRRLSTLECHERSSMYMSYVSTLLTWRCVFMPCIVMGTCTYMTSASVNRLNTRLSMCKKLLYNVIFDDCWIYGIPSQLICVNGYICRQECWVIFYWVRNY